MFYVKKDSGGFYDVVDTKDGVTETIDRQTLIQLVKSGLKIYGVSNSFRVKTFKGLHDIVNQYRLQCELSGIRPPRFEVNKDGNAEFVVLKWQEAASTVVIPEFVSVIGSYCFEDCYEINELIMSDEVITIGERAFRGCSNLKKVRFSNNLKSIGEGCFMFTGFTELILPDSVETIDSCAFEGCCDMTSFKAGSGLKHIEEQAFCNCTRLSNVDLGNVVTIGDNAFFNANISGIVLPDSLERLSKSAFRVEHAFYNVNGNEECAVYGVVTDVAISLNTDNKQLVELVRKAGFEV